MKLPFFVLEPYVSSSFLVQLSHYGLREFVFFVDHLCIGGRGLREPYKSSFFIVE